MHFLTAAILSASSEITSVTWSENVCSVAAGDAIDDWLWAFSNEGRSIILMCRLVDSVAC